MSQTGSQNYSIKTVQTGTECKAIHHRKCMYIISQIRSWNQYNSINPQRGRPLRTESTHQSSHQKHQKSVARCVPLRTFRQPNCTPTPFNRCIITQWRSIIWSIKPVLVAHLNCWFLIVKYILIWQIVHAPTHHYWCMSELLEWNFISSHKPANRNNSDC